MLELEEIRVDILLVDDREDQLLALQSIVDDLKQNVVTARSGRDALRALLKHEFAVIILDVNMPGLDGYETAALIRQRRSCEHTPIIFVSAGFTSDTHVTHGYSLGAVDYIQRPIVPEVLRAKVAVFVELQKKREELRRLQEAEHKRRMQETEHMLEVQTKRNLFFTLSIDMMGIAGFDGYLKQVNPAWERCFGVEEGALKSTPLESWVHPDDLSDFQDQMQSVIAGAKVPYHENRFRCGDDTYRWFGWTAASFADGQLVYIFARDVTERHELEQERVQSLILEQERAARLRSLAAASIAMNSSVEINEVLELITEQARRVLDAGRAETCLTLDSNWSKVIRAKARATSCRDREELAVERSGLEPWLRALEGPFRRTAGEMAADPLWQAAARVDQRGLGMRNCIGAPLTGRQGGTVGYLMLCDRTSGDFTAEDEVLLLQLAQMASLAVTNALYFEAREANRLKDEFLATLSHELRTPLTAILGWTWLLRSGNPDPAAHAEAMEIIERNARAQAKLIDDMLDISRIISGKLRLAQIPVQIQSQVEAAVDAVRPVAHAKSLHLSLAIDRGLPGVIGDPDRLHQVVSNLLSNAIKFTPEGGRIQVRLDGDAGRVRLSVSDTGIGIAPSFLPFVFERFLQAEGGGTRPQGGLGLGLAIVRHLVELHGGSVQAQSKGEGEGSTFVVDLPAAPIAAVGGSLLPALHLVEPQVSEPPTIAGLHVLVVDDDTDSRATIAMVLRQSAAEVVEASSAAEGMALLQKAKDSDDFDVLVSDIAMPEEDGCSFIRRVRQSNGWSAETLPAIAVSAFVRDEDRARAFSAGFQVHLPKPVMPGQLLAAIAGLVAPPARRRRSLSPDTAP